MKIPSSLPRLKGFRYPREVIAYAVWAYNRFALSTANVEDLLVERGVIVSREAVRLWINRLGKHFADYERADARIARETQIPYILIRPAALTEKPGHGKYRVFQGNGPFARPITKEDVAAFLMDALESDQWNGKNGFQLAGLK